MTTHQTPAAAVVGEAAAAAGPLVITVVGKPITQGSKTRTHWGMRDDNAATLKPWRDNVRSAAIDALGPRRPDTYHYGKDVPVRGHFLFAFARPAGHYGTGRNANQVKASAPAFPCNRQSGDVDKLTRAINDSLTDAGVWLDDAQLVDARITKVWCSRTTLALPGARITLERVDTEAAPLRTVGDVTVQDGLL